MAALILLSYFEGVGGKRPGRNGQPAFILLDINHREEISKPVKTRLGGGRPGGGGGGGGGLGGGGGGHLQS